MLGREVTTLVNENKFPGRYTIEFSSKNLASGIYFYELKPRLLAGKPVQTKKMIILR